MATKIFKLERQQQQQRHPLSWPPFNGFVYETIQRCYSYGNLRENLKQFIPAQRSLQIYVICLSDFREFHTRLIASLSTEIMKCKK